MTGTVHLTLQPINVPSLVSELIGSLYCDVGIGIWGVFPIVEMVELISTPYLASHLTFAISLCWTVRKEQDNWMRIISKVSV